MICRLGHTHGNYMHMSYIEILTCPYVLNQQYKCFSFHLIKIKHKENMSCDISKQCAFVHVGPTNITIDAATNAFHYECALLAASHGYILGVHVNERTLLNNVMLMQQTMGNHCLL